MRQKIAFGTLRNNNFGRVGVFNTHRTAGPFTISNAVLQAVLGGKTDFKLRAFFYRGGRRSLDFDQITVRKA